MPWARRRGNADGANAAGHFDPAEFVDHYENALIELLKQKQAGRPVQAVKEAPPPSRVINPMDALRRSVEAGRSRRTG